MNAMPILHHPIDPRRPARRASWMMIALGVGAICFGGLAALIARLWPTLRDQPGMREAVQQLDGLNIDVVQYFYITAASAALYGLTSVVVGIYVRRGTRGPVMAATLLTGIVLGVLVLNLLSGLAVGNIPALIVSVLVVSAHALQLHWLLQARHHIPVVAHVRAGGLQRSVGQALPPPIPEAAPTPMAGYYAPLPPFQAPVERPQFTRASSTTALPVPSPGIPGEH
jgi:hypothetical protein